MRRRSGFMRQQRSDDKIVQINMHIAAESHVAISAISAIAGGHVLALVCRDLVDLVDVVRVSLFDLVVAVKVDSRVVGESAVGVAVTTVAGAVVAGINVDFDRVAAKCSHVSLPGFALKRHSSPSGMTNVLSEFGPGSGDGLDAKSDVIQIGRVYARKVYMPCSDEMHPGKC